jgi:hypothetical protein
LAEKPRLTLERIIPRLYKWFAEKSADSILKNEIQCTRALEPPRKQRVKFATNLPVCRRGHNKFCKVEDFIREESPQIQAALRQSGVASQQIQNACDLFERVCGDPNADLSHSDCRRAGDCLIALEARRTATHALSTNAGEWIPLSAVFKFQFVRVTYPDEQTL